MHFDFIANEAGTEQSQDSIAAGVARSDPSHYLMFSRSLHIGSDDDWGIAIEFDDQINSGYEIIKSCIIQRDRLHVVLSEPIGPKKQYSGFDVLLELSDSEWSNFAANLRLVFTGRDDLLVINDAQPRLR